MTLTQEWLNAIANVRFNPAAMQRLTLSMLERVMGGNYDIANPTSPFVFSVESGVVNAAAAMIENEANTRKQYPSMALTQEELYLHMSDKDYAGRFAFPSRTKITLLFEYDELINRMVATGVGTNRKLVIPRHTRIEIADIAFTMQYPIEIRQMAHGGLQVVYDNRKLSPLETLTTNIADSAVVKISNRDFLRIDIPISQFKITSHTTPISLAAGLTIVYPFEDQFYYARVFYALSDGTWKEMLTTHTDQVFDPKTPTTILKVVDNKLHVSLPQIYLTTGLVTTEMRIDVYTTKGVLEMVLDNYQANAFKVDWLDYEKDDNGRYTAPLTVFTTMAVFSDQVVTGGRNALTFEQLRDRVIVNPAGVPLIPITNVHLTTRLQDLGYDLVKNVDNITNRQFLATRTLPRPADNSVVSGAGCTIQTLSASMAELALLTTVKDNGNRITVLPSTLFQSLNGVLEVVPESNVQALLALPIDIRCRRVNAENYLFTPFHYVLDRNSDEFQMRSYYLDQPDIQAKSYVSENDTVGIAVATGDFAIERVASGYKITLVTKSSEAWKALPIDTVLCQLSYRPVGERDLASLIGTLEGTVDDEYVFTFLLQTEFDLDANDNVVLTSFRMYDDAASEHATALTSDFDVIYAASEMSIVGLRKSDIDLALNITNLPSTTIGITRERLTVKLGDPMRKLWRSTRTVPSSLDYERYTANVPALYETDVFERDASGNIVMTLINNDVTYNILHNAGDPVLDGVGNPVFSHSIGDIKLDADLEPIIRSGRTLVHQLDMCLVDGVYWFATEDSAANYRNTIPTIIVGWVNGDIAQVSDYLLERTELFFYPKSTLGQIPAIVLEDQQTNIAAAQSFAVTYHMRGSAHRDVSLRKALEKMAVETINEALQKPTVSMSDIVSQLKDKTSGDAISLQVTGLGGDQAFTTVTLQDDSARLSVRKIAVPLADGSITVEDDVVVTFIKHTND